MISKCFYHKLNIEEFWSSKEQRIIWFNEHSRNIWGCFSCEYNGKSFSEEYSVFPENQTLRDEKRTYSSGSGKL